MLKGSRVGSRLISAQDLHRQPVTSTVNSFLVFRGSMALVQF
jgi:hypothetical protein